MRTILCAAILAAFCGHARAGASFSCTGTVTVRCAEVRATQDGPAIPFPAPVRDDENGEVLRESHTSWGAGIASTASALDFSDSDEHPWSRARTLAQGSSMPAGTAAANIATSCDLHINNDSRQTYYFVIDWTYDLTVTTASDDALMDQANGWASVHCEIDGYAIDPDHRVAVSYPITGTEHIAGTERAIVRLRDYTSTLAEATVEVSGDASSGLSLPRRARRA